MTQELTEIFYVSVEVNSILRLFWHHLSVDYRALSRHPIQGVLGETENNLPVRPGVEMVSHFSVCHKKN